MKSKLLMAALLTTVCLAGCGGGGGDEPPLSPQATTSQRLVSVEQVLFETLSVASSTSGSVWMAWAERSSADGNVVVAGRMNSSGGVLTSRVHAPSRTVMPDQVQVVMAGESPLVAWMETDVGVFSPSLRLAVWDGTDWAIERTEVMPVDSPSRFRLVAVGDGRAQLVWLEIATGSVHRIEVRQRGSDGSWGGMQTVRTLPAGTSFVSQDAPEVAVDAAGRAMMVWAEEVGGVQTLWSSLFEPGSGVWSVPSVVDAGSRYRAKIAPSGDGGWMAAWITPERSVAERQGLWATRYTHGAWSGSAARIDTASDEEPRDLALAGGQSGNRLAWISIADRPIWHYVNVIAFDDARDQWSASARIANAALMWTQKMRMWEHQAGGAALVWGADNDAMASVADATGAWSAPIRFDPMANYGFAPRLAPLTTGWVGVWAHSKGGADELHATRLP